MKNSETISDLSLKGDFPIFQHSPELVYLDNAATTHKPRPVIDAVTEFYKRENANIQRGIYDLSHQATLKYENVRKLTSEFINAPSPECICFTSGTTHSINQIAFGYVRKKLDRDKNVVITEMEHHSNFIPWQILCKETGAELRIIDITKNGDLNFEDLEDKLDKNTELLAFTHISNTLGTINPIDEMVDLAHKKGIPVLIDAAQSISLQVLDLEKTPVDFLAFSAHKMFGPQGVGILYANEKYHNEINPVIYGGGTINEVSIEKTTFRKFPYRIEAGTQNIAGVVGLGEAINYLNMLNRKEMNSFLEELTGEIRSFIENMKGFNMVGSPSRQSHILSFIHDRLHPHDLASMLNEDHISIRAGFHCTQPLLNRLKIPATARISFSVYNGENDVEKLKSSLKSVEKLV